MTPTTHGYANAGVTVRIAEAAAPHHLRQMAETLLEAASQMEARGAASSTSHALEFLTRMLTAAEAGERVTAEDVARLRRLADWADAAPCPGWNGTLDKHETQRAIEAARARLA